MGKHLRITTCRGLYVARMRCFQPGSGTTTATEKLLKISAPNSFILPSAKLLKDVHFEPASCGSHMNLIMAQFANSTPSNKKNELSAILEVDFGQFCAGPSRERRYKVRSPIFQVFRPVLE